MGMSVTVFIPQLSASLIPEITKRFAGYGMHIEFHPQFSGDETKDVGFVPVKLTIQTGQAEPYNQFSYDIQSGFELAFSGYDYEEELKSIREQVLPPQKKFSFSKLFGANKASQEQVVNYIAGKDHDQLLKLCKKAVIISWSFHNKSELRVALFFAAFLAELCGGIIYDPQAGRYLNASEALDAFPAEINEYENSFAPHEFSVEKFDQWR